MAVKLGSTDSVDAIIKLGKSLANNPESPYENILRSAVVNEQTHMLQHLLNNYYDLVEPYINKLDREGMTPLGLAAQKGDIQTIYVLAQKGADLEQRDAKGRRALHYAALGHHEGVIQALASQGCEIQPADNDEKTPRGLIMNSNNVEAQKCG